VPGIATAIRRPEASVTDDVRLAQAGDEPAFERLYRANVGRVYALCLRMTADSVAARELVQDVFVRAWEKLPGFRGEAAFSSWLHRLAVNVVLADRRARRRRAEDGLEAAEAHAGAVGGGGRAESAGAGGEAGAALHLDLEQAIARLPAMARRVLVLHDLEGYEHREIGRLVGIAEGTSKAHLFRARQILREVLDR
jgi:RNA polymerase sigma-70 factor (ECF subfamily)